MSEKFLLKIIWSNTYLGLAVDKIYNGYPIPLSTFYFWPREDGWELLKQELDNKIWLTDLDKFEILNKCTTIINYWISINSQQKPTIDQENNLNTSPKFKTFALS